MEPVISQKLYNMKFKNDRFPTDEYHDSFYYDKEDKILEITCQNIKFFTTVHSNLFDGLKILSVEWNAIVELPNETELLSLEKLNCSNNRINKIPFYKNLKELIANNNRIGSLENYNNSILEYLDCSFNEKIKLPRDLKKCRHFFCSDSKLDTCDISKYTELINLDLSNNVLFKIFFFKDSNSKIKEINIENNKLDELPVFLSEILYLNCKNNMLTYIPNYPKLKILDASKNKISNFESLNDFEKVIMNDNSLATISAPGAKFIDISNNIVSQIQISEKNEKIYAQFNPISKLRYSKLNLKYIKLSYKTAISLDPRDIKRRDTYVDNYKLKELIKANHILKVMNIESLMKVLVNLKVDEFVNSLSVYSVKLYKKMFQLDKIEYKDICKNKIFIDILESLLDVYKSSVVFVITL